MKEKTIQGTFLGKVIEDYVTDSNIKDVAKRAVWLGNDEVHYMRKWVDKDLFDLKQLIDLVVYWIESSIITENLKKDMPDK